MSGTSALRQDWVGRLSQALLLDASDIVDYLLLKDTGTMPTLI